MLLDPKCLVISNRLRILRNPSKFDFKIGSYCCYVRCKPLIVRVKGMYWPKTGDTHYQRSWNQRVGRMLGVTEPNTPGVWTEKELSGTVDRVSWTAVIASIT